MLESLRGVRPNKAPGLNHRDLVDEDRENRKSRRMPYGITLSLKIDKTKK